MPASYDPLGSESRRGGSGEVNRGAQLELQLEDLEAAATEDELAAEVAAPPNVPAPLVRTRRGVGRKPFPAHLPRERVVIAAPCRCEACGSKRIVKLGEDVTDTLEVVPRQWKVIQTVWEKFTCRNCEQISQRPAPFHPTPRGWAGPNLLATVLFEKFGQHQPLNRQAECYAREDVELSLSTLADQVGAAAAAFAPLPPTPFDACDKRPGRVSSQALVRYKNTDYSVPVAYAHRDVMVKGYVDTVTIAVGSEEIARHPRSYESADFVFDPLHYLALIERKVGALDQAAPLQGWALPDAFLTLRRLLEARLSGKNRCAAGKGEFVQVLRLLETFPMAVVEGAVADALRLGAIGYDAVKHLTLCRVERRLPRLDLTAYPYLPAITVETTSPANYMSLLAGADIGALA